MPHQRYRFFMKFRGRNAHSNTVERPRYGTRSREPASTFSAKRKASPTSPPGSPKHTRRDRSTTDGRRATIGLCVRRGDDDFDEQPLKHVHGLPGYGKIQGGL